MAHLISYMFHICIPTNKTCPTTANMSTRDYSAMWWPWLTPWYHRFIIPISRLPRSPISVAYLLQIQISLEVWNHHASAFHQNWKNYGCCDKHPTHFLWSQKSWNSMDKFTIHCTFSCKFRVSVAMNPNSRSGWRLKCVAWWSARLWAHRCDEKVE